VAAAAAAVVADHAVVAMEQYTLWVTQCRDAVESLRADVKQAKSHRAKCCQVLAAALAARLALEHTIHDDGLSTRQAQHLQRLCASTVAAVELAQQRVQVALFSASCTAVSLLYVRSTQHASNHC